MIQLDNAKKVSDELTKYSSDPNALYNGVLNEQNLSMSEYLEKLDPTETDQNGKPVSRYDAFDRHLMVNDIRINGKEQLSFEELYSKATYLMPELVRREIMKGMKTEERYSVDGLVAAKIPHKGTNYHPLYIENLNNDSAATKKKHARGRKGDGALFPQLSIRNREKSLTIADRGLGIDMSYKVLRYYSWKDVAIVFNLVGAAITQEKLAEIWDLGVTGDGTVGAATNVFAGTDDSLTYADLVHAYSSFGAPYGMGAILADITTFETILAMSQFTEPNSGWKFQNDGTLVTPFGAQLKQVNSSARTTVTAKKAVLIDPKYAVREVFASGLMIEAEKIIDKKIENTVVSEESSYSIIADGAIKQLEWAS